MKYKKFLKIGLMALILSGNLDLANANQKIDDKIISKSPSESDSFEAALKTGGFILSGILGAGALGLTYFLFRLGTAGKISKKSPKQQNESYFVQACMDGNLEKIKYLLNEKSVNIRYDNDLGILRACSFGKLEVVKYLLTSSELKKHLNCDLFFTNI